MTDRTTDDDNIKTPPRPLIDTLDDETLVNLVEASYQMEGEPRDEIRAARILQGIKKQTAKEERSFLSSINMRFVLPIAACFVAAFVYFISGKMEDSTKELGIRGTASLPKVSLALAETKGDAYSFKAIADQDAAVALVFKGADQPEIAAKAIPLKAQEETVLKDANGEIIYLKAQEEMKVCVLADHSAEALSELLTGLALFFDNIDEKSCLTLPPR
jgi:hypothetical protein